MLTAVEDYSRVARTFLLDTKENVYDVFCNFIKMVQTQFGKVIKFLRSDHGSEFMNHKFTKMLDS